MALRSPRRFLLHAFLGLAGLPIVADAALAQFHTLTSPTQREGGYLGTDVASVGDIDGDGVDDLAVTALLEYGGRVHFYSGATGTHIAMLINPSEDGGAGFGKGLAPSGSALVIGARSENDARGRVYVYATESSTLLRTIDSPNPAIGGLFGEAIASMGDLDGASDDDVNNDVIIGAPRERYNGVRAGRAYVFAYPAGTVRELVSPNPEEGGHFGGTVAAVDDLDGDNVADVVVGAYGENEERGRVYVFSGADGSLLYQLASPSPDDRADFGSALAVAGDLDDDGIPDLLVGAWGENLGQGAAYTFSGADGSLILRVASPDPNRGGFGFAVASAGDIDSDGTPDLILGAWESETGGTFGGKVFLISGADGTTVLRSLRSGNPQSFGHFGAAVASTSDLDGDGVRDVLVGAFEERVGGGDAAGRAYVFSGASEVVSVETARLAMPPRLRAWPNPSRGTLSLRLTAPTDALVRVMLHDVLGRERAFYYEGRAGDLDASSLRFPADAASGLYAVRVTGDQIALTSWVSLVR